MKSICAVVAASVLAAGTWQSETPRVLYLTHSAGFKHDVLPTSEQIMQRARQEFGGIRRDRHPGLLADLRGVPQAVRSRRLFHDWRTAAGCVTEEVAHRLRPFGPRLCRHPQRDGHVLQVAGVPGAHRRLLRRSSMAPGSDRPRRGQSPPRDGAPALRALRSTTRSISSATGRGIACACCSVWTRPRSI